MTAGEQQTAIMRALAAAGLARWRVLAALSLSLLMHGGVAYAIWINDAELGRTSRASEAISANAVHSIVIEAVFEDVQEQAASQASLASLKGVEAPDKTQPVPDAEPAAAKPEPLPLDSPKPIEAPVAQPPDPEPRQDAPIEAADLAAPAPDVTSDDTAAERLRDEERRARDVQASVDREKQRKAEQERRQGEDEAERKKADAQHRKAKAASNADSSASRGHEKAARSGGSVSASQGDIMSYAAQVRARVAGNKPSGNGGHGTVVIGFGVSRAGGLAFARVARSSGSPALDQVALAAVRSAGPFPTPPAGVTPGQLTFSIPFYFN